MEDADGIIKRLIPCEYDQKIEVCPGVVIRFTDIGHLLGSASIEVWATEDDVTKKLVFSGDIGNMNQPLIKDPKITKEADYVIMESTYGDRNHSETKIDYVGELVKILQSAFDKGGNVVIPSFAVGRTQEMLYFLRQIKEERLVKGHENFPVYVDSPLAVEATGIFQRNSVECFDEDAMELVRKCEAGRVRHHLKHNLWRQECTILFVGYQANGTLGRAIVEGANQVRLFGETIEIRAKIEKLVGMSGHADKAGLLRWIDGFAVKPERVFVVHGEDSVCKLFTECLKIEHGLKAYAPYSGTRFDLLQDTFIYEAAPAVLKKKAHGISDVFARLVAAGQRLVAVIYKNEGSANKDMARFADQINALCDKYDKDR